MAPRVLVVTATLLLASLATATGERAHAETTTTTATTAPTTHAACDTSARWHCRAEIVDGGTASTGGTLTPRATSSTGYSATRLRAAYGVDASYDALPGAVPTIAVIDAFNYPSAEADLATYRAASGLPPCTVASGCLSILNQDLEPSPLPANATIDNDWTAEDALDLDVASAICPACHLALVEADDDTGDGLLVAAKNAASIAHYVSMSWGGPDDGSTPADQFAAPSTIYTGATGDDGHTSAPDAPTTMKNVVAVGGVSLSGPGGTPTAWSGAGSSCSTRTPQPSVQQALGTGCSLKAAADVSAVADPNTGIRVYDSANGNGGWIQVGGTSAAAPLVAALYADAGNHTDPWTPYATAQDFPALMQDVTAGSNGTCFGALCHARPGWDGPTGIGMPTSPEAVALPLGAPVVTGVPSLTGRYADPVATTTFSLPTSVLDTGGIERRLTAVTAQVTNLPAGVSAHVDGTTVTLSGTPTVSGNADDATIDMTGTTAGGRTTTSFTPLHWDIGYGTQVATTALRIKGTVRRGALVRAVLPTVHSDSATGAVLSPTWRATWYAGGRRVHSGLSYRIASRWVGRKLTVRVSGTVPHYYPANQVSRAVTIRRR